MKKNSYGPTILVDFEGVIDNFTGIPLCTKNDVIALNNAGFNLVLWVSKNTRVDRIQSWIDNERRISDKSRMELLSTRPKNFLLWILQLFRVKLAVHSFQFFYCNLFPGIRFRNSFVRIIRMHDPFSLHGNRRSILTEKTIRTKLKLAKLLRTDAFLSVSKTSLIVCNSNFTAKRCKEIYGSNIDRLGVIYSLVQFEILESHHKDTLGLPYLVFIGGQRQRKDPIRIIELWSHSSLSESLQLVVVGYIPLENLSETARKRLAAGDLRLETGLSAEELRDLISASIGTIFFSYGEGWGQPLAESLACGKTVICNDLEVFHEVVDVWGLFFSTESPEQSLTLMKKLLMEQDIFKDKELQIKHFAQRYELNSISSTWANLLS